MFAYPQTTFMMFSLCYAQCPGYFLCIAFLFLSILKHYTSNLHWFMYHGYAKKIIGHGIFQHQGGSFGSSLCHFTFLFKGLALPSMVQLATFAFLGCWALNVIAFVTRFQSDDHPILLDVVAHIKTNIFPFQLAL
jgi:hypothetical protein